MVNQADKNRFLEALAELGGSAGNVRLREALGWEEEAYVSVKDALIAEGTVTPGRGRGGSVQLAEAQKAAKPAAEPKPKKTKAAKSTEANADLGFEAELFKAADKLRGNLEPSEYKHVALGLIFLKYISEAFEAQYARLQGEDYADPEDPEEYLAANVFWVPPEARWAHLQANAKRPEISYVDVTTGREKKGDIGGLIDNAMEAIEQANSKVLKDVLPKNYSRPQLDKTMLGELIDLFSNVDIWPAAGLVDTEIGCFHLSEVRNATKEVQPRVQA